MKKATPQRTNRLLTSAAGMIAGSMLLLGSATQAQTVISSLFPNGAYQFQSSTALTFVASSPAGITNVSVALTATKMNGTSSIKQLTPSNGLTITGPNTGETISAALSSNRIYSAAITIQDANGVSASTNISFDTISPSYTFEIEDWNYTENAVSGLFFDNPQTNAYAGKGTTDNVDAHNGNTDGTGYRPSGVTGGLSNEGTGDKPRIQYVGTGLSDYNVGWTDNGDWANYTRHYPSGTYNVYVRAANPNGAGASNIVFSGAVQGRFAIPNTGGWQSYRWIPLVDNDGNLVEYTADGSQQTIRLDFVQASCNVNCFMFLPLDTETNAVGDVAIANIYPNGAFQFQSTNTLSFTVTSTANVNAGDITVLLGATNLAGQGTSQLLTSGNGLTLDGTPNNWTVTAALTSNLVYNVTIQVADVNESTAGTNLVFDTVIPGYTFEAEDWNYNAGQFFDNPQVNQYLGIDWDGYSGIDYLRAGGGGGNSYARVGLSVENCGDVPRESQGGQQDYDLGNSFGGNWANYTRTFPVGLYNIYVRVARADASTVATAARISLVTSDRSQPDQITSAIGTFNVPGTGGWQRYQWVPVLNSVGNVAVISGGDVKTLRYTVVNGGHNVSYFMLIPADMANPIPPYPTDFKPDGSRPFQMTNFMTFTANSIPGIDAGGVSVVLNGKSVNSSLTFGGTAAAMTVNCPVESNKLYTAIVTLTDAFGTSVTTNSFETFDPAAFVFEAEDYNYTEGGVTGQFFDGLINAYNGKGSTMDIDAHDNGHQGDPYRAYPPGLEIEGETQDLLRPGYEGTGNPDYCVGYNDGGNWANYTRTYPAGVYNVYMRIASPVDGPNGRANPATLSVVTSGLGTTSQTVSNLGTFGSKYTGGWHSFAWTPLFDTGGAPARVSLTGTVNTLRVSVANGGYNVGFYVLVPADLSIPVVDNAYPNGASRFQVSGNLAFNANSTAGINSGDISVQLTGTDLVGQTHVTNFTSANGLVITGPATSLHVSLPLQPNMTYTAVITVTSSNGKTTTSTLKFDTITPAFLFESEDYNYGGGLFINGSQTNGYLNLNALPGIDAFNTNYNTGAGSVYRTNQIINVENSGDTLRTAHAGLQDYNIGNVRGGMWQNHTRVFPGGVYNIYMRGANGANSNQVDAASLSLVTGDATTSNQTTTVMGTFDVPGIGGWQVYSDVPLIDGDGNYAQIVGGSEQTLRITTLNGNYNASYYFLMPAENTLPVNPPAVKLESGSSSEIVMSFLSRTNIGYQTVFKTSLTDPAWTPVGAVIPGNARVMSVTNAISGNSGFYRIQVIQ